FTTHAVGTLSPGSGLPFSRSTVHVETSPAVGVVTSTPFWIGTYSRSLAAFGGGSAKLAPGSAASQGRTAQQRKPLRSVPIPALPSRSCPRDGGSDLRLH